MSSSPDLETAVGFLKQLRPGGPWLLTAIVPDGKTTTITAQDESAVRTFVSKHNATENIYYSVNPTRRALSKKAAKVDIAAIEFALADLDPADDEASQDAKQRYLEQLNGKFEPQPTAMVDSGNGIQCLWRLEEPIALGEPISSKDDRGRNVFAFSPEDRATIAEFEARVAAVMLRLGATAETKNIDRILRLPGTINHPNKTKRDAGRVPCPTKLIHFNGTAHPLAAFPLPDNAEPNRPGTPDDGGHHSQQPHEDEEDELRRTIRDGGVARHGPTRSEAQWWAINEMLRRGYAPEVIVSVLLDQNNGIAAHTLAQVGRVRAYALGQVAKAVAKNPPQPPAILPASCYLGAQPVTPPAALIKGVLPQTGVAIIGGQSGGGKSFHAIHQATCLIPDTEQNFYIDRYRIKRKGGVIYLVLEGKAAFHLRVAAAFRAILGKQMTLGDSARLPFAWNTYAPNLFQKGPDDLIRLAERDAAQMRREFGVDLVAVYIDTMGLAACYENEDKAAQIQRVITGLSKLSDATGALAIGVDHFGKDATAGLRGTSAKRDTVENILACLVDRTPDGVAHNHRMVLHKVRDGEEGRVIPYRLEVVPWGADEDGDPVTTCRIVWEPDRTIIKPQRMRAQTDGALVAAIDAVGGLPADATTVRAAFRERHKGKRHTADTAWRRAVKAAGLVMGSDSKLSYPAGPL